MKYYTYIFNISRVGASKVFAYFRRVLQQLTVVGRTASSCICITTKSQIV